MARVEFMLVLVLITIALLMGLLFGGSTVWFLKPAQDRIIEKSVNRYVCADGTIKNVQSECPIISSGTGDTKIVCPPCNKTDFIYRKCECEQCLEQCGHLVEGVVTTTTLHVPKCDVCESNNECGQPEYGEIKCRGDQMYKVYSEPFCAEGCCKVTQTQKIIRECTRDERCETVKGCVPYEEEEDEE